MLRKRIVALLAAGAMLTGTLAGCGNSDSGSKMCIRDRQTGLRVEVILRLPEATLQGYRGKSGGRLDAFHPPFPSPAVHEAQRTPPGERPPEVKNH